MWRIKVLKKDWAVFKKKLFIAYAKLTKKKCCCTCPHWHTSYGFVGDYGSCSILNEPTSARSSCESESERLRRFENSLDELIKEEK